MPTVEYTSGGLPVVGPAAAAIKSEREQKAIDDWWQKYFERSVYIDQSDPNAVKSRLAERGRVQALTSSFGTFTSGARGPGGPTAEQSFAQLQAWTMPVPAKSGTGPRNLGDLGDPPPGPGFDPFDPSGWDPSGGPPPKPGGGRGRDRNPRWWEVIP